MNGHAFKCDHCGRVSFVAGPSGDGTPPKGWYALSHIPAVPDREAGWMMWHFDEYECLEGFIQLLGDRQVRSSDVEPEGEVVISEWDGGKDLSSPPVRGGC